MTTPPHLTPYLLTDNLGNSFLSYNASDIPFRAAIPRDPVAKSQNHATFLSETLPVIPRSTTRFSVDLTARDDLILTILSLLLLLVIEAILTTILLRTYNGNVSNFGFSVKQFVELARDFKFHRLIRGGPVPSGKPPRKINFRLLLVASATLVFTFGVEVAVLWLSTPEFTPVTNRTAAFTYEETLDPDWNSVRDNAGSAANRPCVSLSIVSFRGTNIEQGNTRVTPCMTATGDLSTAVGFNRETSEVDMEFETNNHLFGAEHRLRIGNSSASYKMIVYFTLSDRRRKILSKRSQFFTHQHATFYMHRQFVAFLFNEYVRHTGDSSMNLERLSRLQYNQTVADGEDIIVAQINRQERFRKVTSTRYTTKVRGVLPRGDSAMRFAVAYLKGASGVSVKGPALNDMDIGSSSTWAAERMIWQEESRRLNWLMMTILLVSAGALLVVLRYLLKPIGTAEIAAAYVSKLVGAEFGRPVGLMRRDEKKSFSAVMGFSTAADENVSETISSYSDDDTV
eukprot:GFKZ01012617.1.p1 GENE.GFKZ01012617.1~~GFKZ01012617.1.p1  ORF type:complete len:538 (-),score=70.89 GFKZ01012617.1:545-2080(-)